MPKKFCKNCFLLTCFAIAIIACGVWFGLAQKPSSIDVSTLQPQLKQATLLPANFRQVPEFTMTNQQGDIVGQAQFDGQWSIVFFGYTFCPDVCPTSMLELKHTLQKLSDNSVTPLPQVVFVSVDPARDTPEQLQSYMSYFDPRFIGLSGSEKDTLTLTRTLGIVYKIGEKSADSDNYLVDHSAAFLLISPQGTLRAILSAPHDADTIAHDVEIIIKASQS